jgi:sialic acid synthase SpsE
MKQISPSKRDRDIFENLFVLEAANNHWGNLERGLKIVQDFGTVVRYNNVKAAIKFQFRDVDAFIHKDFRGNTDIRYISKTEKTRLTKEEFTLLVNQVKKVGCIPMATPFDEKSVDLCVELDLPIIKIASSDINDWLLIEKIATTKRPVIVSSGGASEQSLDQIVQFFENRNIPLAINHCVSLYPSEDHQLELNQIDYLKQRFPGNVIGFSTHEYHSWEASMYMSYAKGARTWERHIDIDDGVTPVSPYCSLPHQIDQWFKAFQLSIEMSGSSANARRILPPDEIKYLDALVRGVYAKKDLPAGYVFEHEKFVEDFYMAIPLIKGQLSVREVLNGEKLLKPILKDSPVTIEDIDGPYSENIGLKNQIRNRGI